MGAEEKPIDLKQFTKLCQLQCTLEEIAAFFEVSKRTVQRRMNAPVNDPATGAVQVDLDTNEPVRNEYGLAFDRGRDQGKAALRRLQWRHANEKGSHAVRMTEHLSKFWLGETERSLGGGPGGPEAGNLPPRQVKITGGLQPEPVQEGTEPIPDVLPSPFDRPPGDEPPPDDIV